MILFIFKIIYCFAYGSLMITWTHSTRSHVHMLVHVWDLTLSYRFQCAILAVFVVSRRVCLLSTFCLVAGPPHPPQSHHIQTRRGDECVVLLYTPSKYYITFILNICFLNSNKQTTYQSKTQEGRVCFFGFQENQSTRRYCWASGLDALKFIIFKVESNQKHIPGGIIE